MCYIVIQKGIIMISSNEVINLIKGFTLTERLMIIEEVLKNIREENVSQNIANPSMEEKSGPAILSLAGIIDEEEAKVWNSAVQESRQIDKDEW